LWQLLTRNDEHKNPFQMQISTYRSKNGTFNEKIPDSIP